LAASCFDPVVASAVLDRLLQHATVINIKGSSYRMRAHESVLDEKEVGSML
jgi:DNA replication protein DnaC